MHSVHAPDDAMHFFVFHFPFTIRHAHPSTQNNVPEPMQRYLLLHENKFRICLCSSSFSCILMRCSRRDNHFDIERSFAEERERASDARTCRKKTNSAPDPCPRMQRSIWLNPYRNSVRNSGARMRARNGKLVVNAQNLAMRIILAIRKMGNENDERKKKTPRNT